jgi:hypothetical protein
MYWRTKTAAKYLSLSPRTLEKFRSKGIGPDYYRLGKRRVVYLKHDLDIWAQNNK